MRLPTHHYQVLDTHQTEYNEEVYFTYDGLDLVVERVDGVTDKRITTHPIFDTIRVAVGNLVRSAGVFGELVSKSDMEILIKTRIIINGRIACPRFILLRDSNDLRYARYELHLF